MANADENQKVFSLERWKRMQILINLVDPEKCWRTRLLSLSETSIQLRTWPLARLKRTGHPPDRKIWDFAETISAFLATPSSLIRKIWDFAEILWSIFQSREIPTNFHQNLLENTWNWFKIRKKNDEIWWKKLQIKNEKLTNTSIWLNWVWSGAKEWESCRSRKMWKMRLLSIS